jgi:hypothetical protein
MIASPHNQKTKECSRKRIKTAVIAESHNPAREKKFRRVLPIFVYNELSIS